MKAKPESAPRLTRPALSQRRLDASAATIVVTLTALATYGLFGAPIIAFAAAGAGAGYSLSGSV